MSHGWDMVCVDHPLGGLFNGDGEYWNRGESDLADLWAARKQFIAIRHLLLDTPSLDAEFDWVGYRPIRHSNLKWIEEHQNCHIELVDEYGNRHELDMTPKPPRHCPSCTCPPKEY